MENPCQGHRTDNGPVEKLLGNEGGKQVKSPPQGKFTEKVGVATVGKQTGGEEALGVLFGDRLGRAFVLRLLALESPLLLVSDRFQGDKPRHCKVKQVVVDCNRGGWVQGNDVCGEGKG